MIHTYKDTFGHGSSFLSSQSTVVLRKQYRSHDARASFSQETCLQNNTVLFLN